jgi:hypothetical protein
VVREGRPLAGATADSAIDAEVDAEEHGGWAALGLLEFGGEFEAMGREDPVVVIAGEDHGGWVARAFFDVMERAVGEEGGEVGGVVRAAVFFLPCPADGEFVEAEHVHDADGWEGAAEEVGALEEAGTDEETAVGAAADGEPFGFGPAFLDEEFGCADEVVEDVLFAVFHAGLVPCLTKFAAAAEIDLGVDATGFEPCDSAGAEGWGETDIEAAVAVEDDGEGGVFGGGFLVRHEHGDAGTVFGGAPELFDDDVGGIEGDLGFVVD